MKWEFEESYENGVEVRRKVDSNPHMLAVFDDGEKVSEPVAALQAQNVGWMADGYSKAKEKYSDE